MHADLFAHDGPFSPRPAWQVIEAARRQMLTGELSLATTPITKVYLRDGQVYFAERTTDGGLGVRLLVEGVITRQQMGKGALLVSGVEHLGRMFQREPSIDRQSVELCVELMTDDVLTSVANVVVDHYTMTMYKRHANGIDRWLPNRIEVITHIVEHSHLAEPDAVITAGSGPRHRGPAAAEPAVVESTIVEPAVVEPAIVEPSVVEPAVGGSVIDLPTAAHPDLADETVAVATAHNGLDTDDADAGVVSALALAATLGAAVAAPEQPSFSLSSSIGSSLAAAAAAGLLDPSAPLTPGTIFTESAPEAGTDISLAQSAVDAIMSSAISDEVADAVRRALAAIDAAAQPVRSLSPADFTDGADTYQTGAAAAVA